ncbi:hypothetical protein [Flavobacterium lindanitolerans]|uniref:hypothetical protein n=1 Tax=Flavobacterium lindanitolerans TaxID=428988 RepID=UPI00280A25A4|nr:hypothetical protein [Flavobacterium lindanitolerans]MDQ7961538.1 hypothetical protein [Flavobacterium lindanitolerans]
MLPTRAMPGAPKKTATTFDDTMPIRSFMITLILFKEVTLNSEDPTIFFTETN